MHGRFRAARETARHHFETLLDTDRLQASVDPLRLPAAMISIRCQGTREYDRAHQCLQCS
jgi:hypothetical protein